MCGAHNVASAKLRVDVNWSSPFRFPLWKEILLPQLIVSRERWNRVDYLLSQVVPRIQEEERFESVIHDSPNLFRALTCSSSQGCPGSKLHPNARSWVVVVGTHVFQEIRKGHALPCIRSPLHFKKVVRFDEWILRTTTSSIALCQAAPRWMALREIWAESSAIGSPSKISVMAPGISGRAVKGR